MHSLRDVLEQSQKDGVAIGHFNVGDWVLLKAVLASGQELKVPVVVGASEGEREFIGVRQIAALVRSLREECDCPYLNADHTHSLTKAVEAAGSMSATFMSVTYPWRETLRIRPLQQKGRYQKGEFGGPFKIPPVGDVRKSIGSDRKVAGPSEQGG
jgi:fructose-bisphosphate aldolase class II